MIVTTCGALGAFGDGAGFCPAASVKDDNAAIISVTKFTENAFTGFTRFTKHASVLIDFRFALFFVNQN